MARTKIDTSKYWMRSALNKRNQIKSNVSIEDIGTL
jgi:hypothetical protein